MRERPFPVRLSGYTNGPLQVGPLHTCASHERGKATTDTSTAAARQVTVALHVFGDANGQGRG